MNLYFRMVAVVITGEVSILVSSKGVHLNLGPDQARALAKHMTSIVSALNIQVPPVTVAEGTAITPRSHNLDFYQAEADQKFHTDLPPQISGKLDLMKPEGLALAINFGDKQTPDWRCFLLPRSSAADVASGNDNKGIKVNGNFYQPYSDCKRLKLSSGLTSMHVAHIEGRKLWNYLNNLDIDRDNGPIWFYTLDRDRRAQIALSKPRDLKCLLRWCSYIFNALTDKNFPWRYDHDHDRRGASALRVL